MREELDCEDIAGLCQSVPAFAGCPLCIAGPPTPRCGVPGIRKIRHDAHNAGLVFAFVCGPWCATSMNKDQIVNLNAFATKATRAIMLTVAAAVVVGASVAGVVGGRDEVESRSLYRGFQRRLR